MSMLRVQTNKVHTTVSARQIIVAMDSFVKVIFFQSVYCIYYNDTLADN